MSSKTVIFLCATALAAGCSDKSYEHRRLDENSSYWRDVTALMDRLSQTDDDHMDAYLAAHSLDELDEMERESLRYALRAMRDAESMELLRMDAFGPKVCRATLILQPHDRTMAMLLVEADDKSLRWAGMN